MMRKELNWLGIVVFLIVIGLCAEWKRRSLNDESNSSAVYLSNQFKVGLDQDSKNELEAPLSSTDTSKESASKNAESSSFTEESGPVSLKSTQAFKSGKSADPAGGASGAETWVDPRYPNRVSNSSQTLAEISRSESGILLRNALIDTASGKPLNIPSHLKATPDTRSFLVQSKFRINGQFRSELEDLGAEVIAYVPNNAYLVRVQEDKFTGVNDLELSPSVKAAIPFEPYYKLDTDLLDIAVREAPLPSNSYLNLTLFPSSTEPSWEQYGFRTLSRSTSPFGNNVTLEWVGSEEQDWTELARMEETQAIEFYYPRTFANDLSRTRLAVSETSVTNSTNHLNLTGKGIVLGINDSGVDQEHPDLTGRVATDTGVPVQDLVGHGTHVAGSMIGNGSKSDTVTNTPSGSEPGADFSGMAPEASLFSMQVDLDAGPVISDNFLIETAADYNYNTLGRTDPMASNNSWGYGLANEYNSSSATFDAAVRDALVNQTGDQPMIFVFAAGNDGFGNDSGLGGEPNSISSPATAKNVITVGAIEHLRELTNATLTYTTNQVEVLDADGNPELDENGQPVVEEQVDITTNELFMARTDNQGHVASYSSRGNVGLGQEGDFGRFKPDLVAPGTFVISTRSKDWAFDTNGVSSTDINRVAGQTLAVGEVSRYTILLPSDTVSVTINAISNNATAIDLRQLQIIASRTFPPEDVPEFTGPGSVNFTPPASSVWYYAVRNDSGELAEFDIETRISRSQPGDDDEMVAMQQLNDELGEYYRYETGTSMSAPLVTGMIGLMQQFFEERLRQGYSPALIKALLINGARSAGPLYDFQVNSPINFQGWGVPNLQNSLPEAMDTSPNDPNGWPVRFFDVKDEEALTTGESHAYRVRLNKDAFSTPLRISLVWTDPPGNPLAGIKLVNDLDLVVSNVVSRDVFIGNNFPFESDFTESTNSDDTDGLSDLVNNVENIFIQAPFDEDSQEYVVYVRAARVNVNAVKTHPDGIAQDYALVISTGDTTIENPFEVTPLADPALIANEVVTLTNDDVLTGRVGANSPLVDYPNGQTTQWNFYEFTVPVSAAGDNTNVAFVTFVPPNLSRPRSTEQADVDLYVSQNPALFTLSQAALDSAFKSVGPRGTEAIAFTNGVEATTYYIAVKSEDYQGGEFKLLSSASNVPFSECSGNSCDMFGRPFGTVIPDGSPENPGEANPIVFIASPADQTLLSQSVVRNVVVTNIMTHQSFGDLLGNLSFNNTYSVLHNHTTPDPLYTIEVIPTYDPSNTNSYQQFSAIYDDSGSGANALARSSDGPGSLNDFIGNEAAGVWLFSVIDNALTGEPGYIDSVGMRLDVTSPSGVFDRQVVILPNGFERDVVRVPPGATELTITTSLNGPLNVYVRRGEVPTTTEFDKQALMSVPGGVMTVGLNDAPPLSPGIYHILFANPSGATVDLTYSIDITVDPTTIDERIYASQDAIKVIADHSITTSVISVPDDRVLSDIKAAVRIDHPRASDLALKLRGPNGQEILLSEHRGGDNPSGFGDGSFRDGIIFTGFTMNTNLSEGPIKFAQPPYTAQGVATNVVETDFEGIDPRVYVQDEFVDQWEVLRDDVEVLNDPAGASGGDQYLVLNNGRIRLPVPTVAGLQYELKFDYRSSVQDEQVRLILELPDGRLLFPGSDTLEWTTIDPAPVFTAQDNAGVFIQVEGLPANAFMALDNVKIRAIGGIIYYTPEESLNEFLEDGLSSLGDWTLEIEDARAGALGGEGLINWQLRFGFAPLPIDGTELFAATAVSATLEGSATHYYYIDAPRSATIALNNLTSALDSDEMILRADRRGFPVGNPSNDEYTPVFTPVGGGSALLTMDDTPPELVSGQRYFLAVENVDTSTTNSYTLEVTFNSNDPNEADVPELTLGTPVTADVTDGLAMDYYKVRISDTAIEASFELTDLTGDADLYIRKATDSVTPLPTLIEFDWAGIQSGTTDELIHITDQSFPPLETGLWYIGVLNKDKEIQPVTYTLTVNEVLPAPVGGNLATPTITGGDTAVLSWSSNPGEIYVLESSPDLSVWNTVEVIMATGATTTVSDSLEAFLQSGSGARFYRVRPATADDLD